MSTNDDATTTTPTTDTELNDDSMSMRLTCFGIRKRFPNVQQVSTSKLNEWLLENRDILILDTRPLEEYNVSHLKDARRLEPDDCGGETAQAMLKNIPCDKPVIFYCSVGYRSSMVAKQLIDLLPEASQKERVYNLEGSIFKWANENRPLKNSEGTTTQLVHPYNAFWGKLLNKSKHYQR